MLRHLFVLVLASTGLASATSVSYIDPFGSNATSCDNSSCDVIGDKLFFDLDRLSLNVDVSHQLATLSISLNFGNDNFSTFDYSGILLDPADVLFTVDGTVRFGVPLTSHAGSPNGGPTSAPLTAGNFYQVTGPAGTMTAFDVLQATNAIYRPGYSVWLRDDGQGSVIDVGGGTVTVNRTGDGVTSGRLTISIAFTPTAEFLNDFQQGNLGLQFASATCGNDILIGQPVSPDVPESAPSLLVGVGLLALWISVRWRSRYRGQLAAPTIRPVFGS
jgi:hypothetical protein